MGSQASSLPLERSFYVGNILSGIFYGIQLCITFHSIYLLITAPPTRKLQFKRTGFYVGYGIVMLLCMTFAMLANALMGQMMWIEHRDFPGGPLAYWASNGPVWYNVLGSATDMFGNFLGDALLLYRCYIIWSSHWPVVILPSLIFLASTAMAIISVVESALPGSSFFQQHVVNFAVPWISLTCSLNALVTSLIIARIFLVRYQMKKILPGMRMANDYTGVIAILVESALPFTILGIAFAVVLGKNSSAQLAFSLIWGSYVGIAPQLIILRVAMGRAWSKDTMGTILSGPNFAQGVDQAEASATKVGTLELPSYASTKPSNTSTTITIPDTDIPTTV